MVRDVAAQARHWLTDETRKAQQTGDPDAGGAVLLGGGESYGVAVTFVMETGPGADGQQVFVPVWFAALTRDNPVLSEPKLSFCLPVGSPEPDEAVTRQVARAGVAALRALHRQKTVQNIAGMNGNGPVIRGRIERPG